MKGEQRTTCVFRPVVSNATEIETPFNDWLKAYKEGWTSRCGPDLAGTIARSGANALKLTAIFQADS